MNLPDPYFFVTMILIPIVWSVVQILTQIIKVIVGM